MPADHDSLLVTKSPWCPTVFTIYYLPSQIRTPAHHDSLLTVFTMIHILQIDFSALVDVRVLTSGGSKPGNKAVTCVNEASTNNVNALKTVLPVTSGEPTAEPSPGMMFTAIQSSTEPNL